MGILVSVVLPLALAFIMFSLGLSLTLDDFRRVLVRPLAFFTGAVSQILVVPFIALVLVVLFAPPPELAVGIMILSFCPGGVCCPDLVEELGGLLRTEHFDELPCGG